MLYHLVQVFIYPVFSSLLLYILNYGAKDKKNTLIHFMFISAVGFGSWYLRGELDSNYLVNLLILFLILFPSSIGIGFFSVWMVSGKKAPKSAYQHSLAQSWTAGSFLVSALAS